MNVNFLRKNQFISIFFIINIIFIFIIIFKKSYETHLIYVEQKLEKELQEIKENKTKLKEELFQLKDPKKIKQFAKDNLKMRDTKISEITKIKL